MRQVKLVIFLNEEYVYDRRSNLYDRFSHNQTQEKQKEGNGYSLVSFQNPFPTYQSISLVEQH